MCTVTSRRPARTTVSETAHLTFPRRCDQAKRASFASSSLFFCPLCFFAASD